MQYTSPLSSRADGAPQCATLYIAPIWPQGKLVNDVLQGDEGADVDGDRVLEVLGGRV